MASALTTVSNVKDYLGINVTTFDSVLDLIVDGVNQGIENKLNQVFSSATYTNEEYDILKDTTILVLKRAPVITFTQLQYKDSPLNEDEDSWTTIDSDEYKVDLGSGIITWNSQFQKGKQRYRVTYTAGYATIPDDITLAATILSSSYFNNRKSQGVQSETLGQYSRTFVQDKFNWDSLGLGHLLDKYMSKGSTFFDSAYSEKPEPTALL